MQAYEVKAEELYNLSNKLHRLSDVAWGVENLAKHYEVEGVAESAAKVKDELFTAAQNYRRLRRYAKDNQDAIFAVDIEKVKQESEAALKKVTDLFKSRYGL